MFSASFNTEVVSGNMECQRSDRPAAESSFTFKKLEEILPLKEMRIALLKLQNYSSLKHHSTVKDLKSNASRSKHNAIRDLSLINEISQDSCLEAKNEDNKREMSLANSSGSKFHGNSRTGKQVLRESQIEELSKRLEFLEKESKTMKQELLEQVEERKKLVNEIYQKFQKIYRCLQLENPGIVEGDCVGPLIVNNYEMGEVETKDSRPRTISADRRTNLLALREAQAPEEI